MNLHFGSVCVRNPQTKFQNAQPHMESIVASTTFSYDDPEALMEVFLGEQKGFIYSRWSNPTIELAENKVAALEACGLNDSDGLPLKLTAKMFSSGMGAISTLFLANLKTGDKVLAQENLYGGTSEFLNKFLSQHDVEPVLMDLKNLQRVEEMVKQDGKIKMLYIETPSNPTIDCYDIEALTNIAKSKNLLVAVDNTFASPYLQQPFRFGVDFVVHSTTKYMNGHGNSIGGMLISREDSPMNKAIFDHRKLLGSNSNAFDAWLLLQGVKTLEIRMQRHCLNAIQVAQFLITHQKVSKVNYAGLPSHRDHAVAKKQMRDFSGMLSFELKDGLDAGKDLMKNIRLCQLAVSLGTVDTIIQHPASMSHVGVAKSVREQYGITDGLVRLSVGIEDAGDLISDLEQALGIRH
ncbi:MAG: aminotransferase class I/II-fold pyridoxal phosphate-dependent enzyme [Chitinophagaceae bacterium]|nr:aminotransferase class I/II-fold pyridoxal phosphate-dependent enzyme [Chitinophagaceae bacterium]